MRISIRVADCPIVTEYRFVFTILEEVAVSLNVRISHNFLLIRFSGHFRSHLHACNHTLLKFLFCQHDKKSLLFLRLIASLSVDYVVHTVVAI